MNNNFMAGALALARHGLLVIPIAYRQKAPPLFRYWPDRATSTEEDIQEWWRTWPSANVGVHCSSLLVLDVDVRPDRNGMASLDGLLANHGPLPTTVVSRTPSGGFHYWFRCAAPIQNSTGHKALGPGLDVRTHGGYVAAPPSITADGAYTWLQSPDDHPIVDAPAWLIEKLLARAGGPAGGGETTQRHQTRPIRADDALVRFALRQDLEAVATAVDGCRNHTLYCKAKALSRFEQLDLGELRAALLDAAIAAGLEERKADATIMSAFRNRGRQM